MYINTLTHAHIVLSIHEECCFWFLFLGVGRRFKGRVVYRVNHASSMIPRAALRWLLYQFFTYITDTTVRAKAKAQAYISERANGE